MEIIKSSAEISTLFKEGRRIATPGLTLIVLRNENQHDHEGRAAFVAGKKLGNAVWRNRAKRRMRSAARNTNMPKEGYDMVFIAKKSTNTISYSSLIEGLVKASTQLKEKTKITA